MTAWDRDFVIYLACGAHEKAPNHVVTVGGVIRPMTLPFRMFLVEGKRNMGDARAVQSRSEKFRLYLVEAMRNLKDVRNVAKVSPWPLRLLLSYYYYADMELDETLSGYFPNDRPDLFIDSGAFSAWAQDESVDLKAYADYLFRWKHLASVYATLDVIGDAEGTRKNTLYLRRRGLDPLDVFHVREDWKNLERMCRERSYVALGGMVPYASARGELRAWLRKCFRIAEKASASEKEDVRFHGFGMSTWQNIRDFPWRSVDSSSWGQGFRYGQIPLFDPERGRWYQFKRTDAKVAGKAFKLNRLLQKFYGVSAGDLVLKERWHRNVVCAIAGMSYVYMEAWINAKREGKDFSMYLVTWPPTGAEALSEKFVGGETQWRSFANLMSGPDPRVAKEKEGSTWQGPRAKPRRRPRKDLREKLGRKAGRIKVAGRSDSAKDRST